MGVARFRDFEFGIRVALDFSELNFMTAAALQVNTPVISQRLVCSLLSAKISKSNREEIPLPGKRAAAVCLGLTMIMLEVVMRTKEKLLVTVDEQSASAQVVKYLGRIISGRKNLEVCLVHMLPPFPPQLREFRGSEDSDEEIELDREVDVSSKHWIRKAETAAQPVLKKATSILIREGVPADSIRCLMPQLVNHEDLTDDILKTAKENKCQTIVVGRSSLPWIKETFRHHLADKLVRKASGITVWVVEQPSVGS